MKRLEKKLLCKNCPFYSGITCHGHGDFWGECNLLVQNASSLKRIFNLGLLCSVVPKGKDCWGFVVNDDSECKVFDVLEY